LSISNGIWGTFGLEETHDHVKNQQKIPKTKTLSKYELHRQVHSLAPNN